MRSKNKRDEQRTVRIQLAISLDPPKRCSASLLLDCLDCALTGLFGIIGGAIPVELIDYDNKNATGTIRCRKSDQQRIWAAVAFQTHYKGSACQVQVVSVSSEPGVAVVDS